MKGKIAQPSESFKIYYEHGDIENNILIFVSFLRALIVKNRHILAGIYFLFLKKRRRPNLKSFLYQIWTSMKSSEK